MNRHLHIICFTIPYPPDYGGVFDLYHKIIALHRAGVLIHLHCFTAQRVPHDLDQYCEEIFYYQRTTGIRGLSFSLPYIVSSRISSVLVQRLNNDEYPVLIEGVHSTGFLLGRKFRTRKIALRLHNVEHIYYSNLVPSSRSILNKLYYLVESRLLFKYEKVIAQKVDRIFTVALKDAQYYERQFNAKHVSVLPVFLDFSFTAKEGRGCYCLYHGNLAVPENEKVVLWLLQKVLSTVSIPFIIAGKNPSSYLKNQVKACATASLVCNPSDADLQDLISKAQCHVLPSLNQTGIKLKLLHALYSGRHCIVNNAAIEGTGLENICRIADSPAEFRNAITELYQQPITASDLIKRKEVLNSIFNSGSQAAELIRWLS